MKKIAIVEDNPANAELLKEILFFSGYQSEIFSSGELFLRSVKHSCQFDLILLDLSLPQQDGFSVFESFINLGYLTPVIAVTAMAMPDQVEQVYALGFAECITKPIHKDSLLLIINRIFLQEASLDESASCSCCS